MSSSGSRRTGLFQSFRELGANRLVYGVTHTCELFQNKDSGCAPYKGDTPSGWLRFESCGPWKKTGTRRLMEHKESAPGVSTVLRARSSERKRSRN